MLFKALLSHLILVFLICSSYASSPTLQSHLTLAPDIHLNTINTGENTLDGFFSLTGRNKIYFFGVQGKLSQLGYLFSSGFGYRSTLSSNEGNSYGIHFFYDAYRYTGSPQLYDFSHVNMGGDVLTASYRFDVESYLPVITSPRPRESLLRLRGSLLLRKSIIADGSWGLEVKIHRIFSQFSPFMGVYYFRDTQLLHLDTVVGVLLGLKWQPASWFSCQGKYSYDQTTQHYFSLGITLRLAATHSENSTTRQILWWPIERHFSPFYRTGELKIRGADRDTLERIYAVLRTWNNSGISQILEHYREHANAAQTDEGGEQEAQINLDFLNRILAENPAGGHYLDIELSGPLLLESIIHKIRRNIQGVVRQESNPAQHLLIPQNIHQDLNTHYPNNPLVFTIYHRGNHFYSEPGSPSSTIGDGSCFVHAVYQALLREGVNLSEVLE
jgi:hypothetical protein